MTKNDENHWVYLKPGWERAGERLEVAPGIRTWRRLRRTYRWNPYADDDERFDEPAGYDVIFEFEAADGRMRCEAVTFRSVHGGPEVTAEGVRPIPLAKVKVDALAGYAALEDADGRSLNSSLRRGRLAKLAAAGPTEETLKAVALVYRAAHVLSQNPTNTVADMFDKPRPTAARWIAMAREPHRGYLGPALDRQPGEELP